MKPADGIRFLEHNKPDVKDPIFVEGLPGVGNVGKLAADHLVDALAAVPWCDIHSHSFPPQVMVQSDGTVRRVKASLWTAKAPLGGRDVVLMTGDFQPLTPEGQHQLVEAVLDRLADVGCKELYTLGGYGLGVSVDEPEVLGAATDEETVARLSGKGVKFEDEEPGGGIIGASGLFLGIGMERGLQGACLMGETSGFMVDPKASRAILDVLAGLLGIKNLPTDDLDDKAAEMDRIAQQVQEADASALRTPDGDLHYFG